MRNISLVRVVVYSIFLFSCIDASVDIFKLDDTSEDSTKVSEGSMSEGSIVELPTIVAPHDTMYDPTTTRDLRGSGIFSNDAMRNPVDQQNQKTLENDDYLETVILSPLSASDESFLHEMGLISHEPLIKSMIDGYRILINNQSLSWLQAEERYLMSRHDDLRALSENLLKSSHEGNISDIKMLQDINNLYLKMVNSTIQQKRNQTKKSWLDTFVSLATDLY